MKFSIFEDDHTIGRNVTDPPQLPPIDPANCNCLHGTAAIDARGNCTCVDTVPVITPPVYTGPPRGQWGQNGAGGIWAYMPFSNTNIQPDGVKTPAPDADAAGFFSGTIFGLPTGLVLLGGGAAALWLFSTMDGKK